MIVGVGEIGVGRREKQHRRGGARERAHEERKVIAAAARLQPHCVDAARQGLGQPELKVVGPAGFNHVVVMELQRAILIRLFEEGIARAVPIAPGHAALAAIDNAAGRVRRKQARCSRLRSPGRASTRPRASPPQIAPGAMPQAAPRSAPRDRAVGESILPLNGSAGDPVPSTRAAASVRVSPASVTAHSRLTE